jgi:hypothetical protein
VHRESVVTEIACEATGSPACIFEVRWGAALYLGPSGSIAGH